MDAHEVLVAARNLIDRKGWEQGFTTDDAPHCAVSAVFWVGGREDAGPLRLVAGAAGLTTLDYPDDPGVEVGFWNDAPGRTKAEVLAAFDRAIAATAPLPADPFPRDVAPKAKSLTLDRSAVLSGGGDQ